ncbi:glycoside hydrolase family 97 catalytic domain-containing protein [Rufibacter sediminis]|uniref:Glycoside hydrolase family 97 catalytic domain-containing protein n=1 Tax=Rufibacter sediminis TaxID=2762756 RepID=A0ABR6VX39_9BACT|nr:glycoside hydrolase family 97 protein [Rufibacter sediminis]MBC3541789.1 glycoside hydrolase family 97 catalytic domain-containing protein [Rufibacter sediminis]
MPFRLKESTSRFCKYPFFLLALGLLVLGACSQKSSTSSSSALEKEYTVQSPDNSIAVRFFLTERQGAAYAITREGAPVLQASKLGVKMEDADLTQGLVLESVSGVETVKDDYEILTAKRRNNTYRANKRTFHLKNAQGQRMDVIFQVSNDGVAFRYYFPGQASGIKKITQEITSFKFPESAKGWLQPMSDAKTGWSETNPSYEEHYLKGIPVGTPSPIKAGWVFPALFESGNSWVLITESGPDGSYCASRLAQNAPGGEYSIAFPQAAEKMAGGPVNPESELPWYSPWRILAVGSLKTITESTLGTDLAKPAKNMDQSFIKPGKAAWSWALLKDDSIVYDVQKRFIDYAARMNWSYSLIDVNWDQKIGYDKMKELADYAKTKNVGLLLWYNSAGPWNTAPYTPRDKMLTHESRMQEFARLREMGIKGVKIDFFGGDGQSVMQYYNDILNDAAENKLLVNFHGCTLPRGWQRTYPNLMTMESIKGFEFITFEQQNADEEAAHAATIPFTRNAFDPMDFTPVNLDQIPRITRRTTKGFELALSVLFISGIQHYVDIPQGMAKQPAYVQDFLREVPSVWEDSKFIDGYPGKLAVIARKANGKWYVAGINGENSAKNVELDLSFLNGKKGSFISDGTDASGLQQKTLEVAANGKTTVELKPNGGFVMVF